MSWCDKLASTPSVGLKLNYHFASSGELLGALSPVFDGLVQGDTIKFTINRQDPFAIEFTTENGFHYGIEPSRVWVDFQHRMKIRPTSGGPPIAEMLSRPTPYSELLPDVSRRLVETMEGVLKIGPRTFSRLGIVATTTIASDELPPGMLRFIEYINRPWGRSVEHYTFQINAELSHTPSWTDRCNHILIKAPEEPDQLVRLQLDWNRTFTSELAAKKESIEKVFEDISKESLQYFEDLAEGNRFDEELIRSTA
jgi:hypothetical protein